MRWKRLAVICAFAGAILFLSGCGSHAPAARAASPRTGAPLQLSGVMEPASTADIEPPLRSLAVPLNSWVRHGQVVGEADPEASAGGLAVRAPADGVLVASDLAEGKYGIAENARRLSVFTLAPEGDIRKLHVDQKATLVVEDNPGLQLTGTVSGIAEEPITSSDGGGYYPVTLTVENPSALPLSGLTVDIHLETAPE